MLSSSPPLSASSEMKPRELHEPPVVTKAPNKETALLQHLNKLEDNHRARVKILNSIEERRLSNTLRQMDFAKSTVGNAIEKQARGFQRALAVISKRQEEIIQESYQFDVSRFRPAAVGPYHTKVNRAKYNNRRALKDGGAGGVNAVKRTWFGASNSRGIGNRVKLEPMDQGHEKMKGLGTTTGLNYRKKTRTLGGDKAPLRERGRHMPMADNGTGWKDRDHDWDNGGKNNVVPQTPSHRGNLPESLMPFSYRDRKREPLGRWIRYPPGFRKSSHYRKRNGSPLYDGEASMVAATPVYPEVPSSGWEAMKKSRTGTGQR